jgi:ATP-dependent metalloprotease FtsH
MDGFEQNSGVIIIAATNRPDVLDPALLRPGRFDRQVVVDRPDVKGREGIFRVHTKNIPLAENVKLDVLAKGTPGLSGADIANLVNEAALLAARQNCKVVEMLHFEAAKDKVMMGMERKSLIISDREKRVTAYHEAGHVLVSKHLPDADPVHKVTIIPRGRALGVTTYLPIDEKHTYSKAYLEAMITYALGGRAAEKLIFGELTTGAGNDIERATEIARKMVCEWGMSEKLGPLAYGQRDDGSMGRRADMVTAMVGINLPLWYKSKQERKVAESQKDIQSAKDQLAAVTNEIRFMIGDKLTEIERAEKQLELLKTGIIPLATLSLDSAMSSYRVNKVDFITVLDSLMTLFKYEIQYYRWLTDSRKSIAEIEAAVGGSSAEEKKG